MGTLEALASFKPLTRGQRPIIVTPGVAEIIKNPSHYTLGAVEVREFLEANGIAADFYVGNVIKYLIRYPYKNGLEDIRKALRYCEMLVEMKERCEAADRRRLGLDDTEVPDVLY